MVKSGISSNSCSSSRESSLGPISINASGSPAIAYYGESNPLFVRNSCRNIIIQRHHQAPANNSGYSTAGSSNGFGFTLENVSPNVVYSSL